MKKIKGLAGILAGVLAVGAVGTLGPSAYSRIMDKRDPSRIIVRDMANQTSLKLEGGRLEAEFGDADAYVTNRSGDIIYTLVEDGKRAKLNSDVDVGPITLHSQDGTRFPSYLAFCKVPEGKECFLVVKKGNKTKVVGLEGEVDEKTSKRILSGLK